MIRSSPTGKEFGVFWLGLHCSGAFPVDGLQVSKKLAQKSLRRALKCKDIPRPRCYPCAMLPNGEDIHIRTDIERILAEPEYGSEAFALFRRIL